MRADGFVGQLTQAVARRTPAFQSGPGKVGSFGREIVTALGRSGTAFLRQREPNASRVGPRSGGFEHYRPIGLRSRGNREEIMTRSGDAVRGRSRAEAIRKIFIAVLVGGVAYYFIGLTNQPRIWVLTVSVFIGGITLVVQFLNDFENRLENAEVRQAERSAEMRSLIEEGFARTNEATELFQAVEASALQTDAVAQLVRHATQIDPGSPPLVYGFAQLQINRMSQFLKELSEGGDVSYDGEDRDWVLGLTMQSQRTLIATSLSTVDAGGESFDGGLWTSDFGLRYLELQREAVRRGVAVRRVFIVDRPEQTHDADLLRICRQQKDLGIQVRVLNGSEIPAALLFDFVVFDNVIGYEVTPASRVEVSMRPMMVRTYLIRQSERLEERIRRFEDLWFYARELE